MVVGYLVVVPALLGLLYTSRYGAEKLTVTQRVGAVLTSLLIPLLGGTAVVCYISWKKPLVTAVPATPATKIGHFRAAVGPPSSREGQSSTPVDEDR